jgi:dTDP-4-amino-4,6-dideoxygalactose transaminase
MAQRRVASDFRYETGPAAIPWTAVGEHLGTGDVIELVRFLVPCGADRRTYRVRMVEVRRALERLFRTAGPATKLTLGGRVKALEEHARRFLGVRHAIFLTNATAGFEIAYKMAGLGPGDEVIAPAITFIATIVYPLAIGAKVVLADVDPTTINMDPADVARKITRRTKVIIPVHIGGYPADMAPIMRMARARGIMVIEDAAHAYGAVYRGRMVGTIGDFGAFSFHEVKNITSLGEGGLLVTNTRYGKDLTRARFVGLDPSRRIPNWLYDVRAILGKGGPFAAGNHSATEIQAVALLSQMRRLQQIISARRRAAEYLTRRFSQVSGIITPRPDTRSTRSTHHLYLLQIAPETVGGTIQELKPKLAARGITQIPHFAPLYKFRLMRELGYDTEGIARTCPNAEEAFNRRFTHLPLYKFTRAQLKFLADSVVEAVKELRKG